MSGLRFTCLVGITLKRAVLAESLCDAAIAAKISLMVKIGMGFMAMMVLSRRIECQQEMCAASMEGIYNLRRI